MALVELKEEVPFSKTDRVGEIELATATDTLVPSTCTGYGWGCQAYGECGASAEPTSCHTMY